MCLVEDGRASLGPVFRAGQRGHKRPAAAGRAAALGATACTVLQVTVPLLRPAPHAPQVPLSQIFRPLVSVESPAEGGGWGSHPLTRLGVGTALAGVLYVLYSHAPDKGGSASFFWCGGSELLPQGRCGVGLESYHPMAIPWPLRLLLSFFLSALLSACPTG